MFMSRAAGKYRDASDCVCDWSASCPSCFAPGERAPCTHWIGGWVDPRAGLDDVEKRKFLTLSGLELRPLHRTARSQSLYRLRYPRFVLGHSTCHPIYCTYFWDILCYEFILRLDVEASVCIYVLCIYF
jgi:hypothetical protein